jgi:uncharacterized protein YndB with AHSA1/START domain
MTNSVILHRVIKTNPEKLFRAFSNPNAMAAWLPPYGFLCTVQEYDFSIGGSYKLTFHNFTNDTKVSFGGEFLEIKPYEFLRYTDRFDDVQLAGEMLTTISILEVMGGSDLKISQTGIPEMIPAEMCYLGWQESLEKLTKLVEPVIEQ